MMDLGSDVHLETLENRNIDKNKEVHCTTSEPRWMDPVIHYLKTGILPNDRLATCKVSRQAPHYVLLDNKLYKRSYTFSLLKCILPSESNYAMREVPKGIYDNHLEGRALTYKIL